MGSRRPLFGLLVAALATVCAQASGAEPTAQQKELARDLMHKGYAARGAHDLKTALESFKGADEIMHVPTTGFELARSQADLGLLVEAHETLLSVTRLPDSPGAPQAFRDARGYAKTLDEQIVPRIPQIRIAISGAASATVAVDDTALPEGALLVPYKVDPGHHVITAKTEGMEGRAETDVLESESKAVTVALVPVPSSVAAVTPAPPPPGPESSEPPVTTRHHRLGPLAWGAFGLAAAGVAVGAVTGIMTLDDKSSIASQCNGARCPPSTYDALSSADTLATVSTVSFIVAGVAAAAGVAVWFVGTGAPQTAPGSVARIRITPRVGPAFLGADGTF